MKKIEILEISYHRNGVGGMPFYVLTFKDEGRTMVGVCFPDEYGNFSVPDYFVNPHTAVFDIDLLAEGNIRFGENSWRGDRYDHQLRKAIVASEPDEPENLEIRIAMTEERKRHEAAHLSVSNEIYATGDPQKGES